MQKEKIMLVKTYAKDWLNNKKINIKVRSSELYEYYFSHLILPDIGENEIENLSTEIIQDFVLSLTNKNSTSTIISCYKVLKQFLIDYYEQQGILPIVKFKKIKLPTLLEKKIDCFSKKEQQKIESRLNIQQKPYRIGILLSLYTGLRLGELLALTWDNVDFTKNVIYVERSVHYKNKQLVYSTPKTVCSTRAIPIPVFIQKMLKQVKKRGKNRFVVSTSKGEPYIPRSYQYMYKQFLQKYKIPYKNFHSLRHTFATRSVEYGMDIKSLSELMGHANPMITLERYTHSMLDYKRQMLNKMATKIQKERMTPTKVHDLFTITLRHDEF